MSDIKPYKKLTPSPLGGIETIFTTALKDLEVPYPSIPLNGWANFNEYVGGFRAREYTVLCGPTGAGKTALLASWSAQLLKQEVRQFIVSVENGASDYMRRVMSCLHGSDLNTGKAIEKTKLQEVSIQQHPFMKNDRMVFSLFEDRFSVDQLMSDIENAYKNHGSRIVIVDNLNFFLQPTRGADATIEMDRVVHELVVFCKSIDVHIIMVQHPRKTDGGRIESEFDIKGSSTAVQEAHNVLLFNRVTEAQVNSFSGRISSLSREIKISKLRRRGAYAGRSIFLNFTNGNYVEALAVASHAPRRVDPYAR